jgi:predicted YcjX-like family ATPase
MKTFREMRMRDNQRFEMEKLYTGTYRIRIVDEDGEYGTHFGQIKKDGRQWNAEIRHSRTGDISRYAGVWPRKQDAIDEVKGILERGYI